MSTFRGTARLGRGGALAVAALVLTAACSSGSGAGPGAEPAGSDGDGGGGGAAAEVSALDDRFDPRLPDPLIDPDEIKSGGPPPDGIPAIDDPQFQKVGEVTTLRDPEAVLSLTVGDETRAYPLRIMTWHEIVNDTVGDVPVTVTYCPLCNSGVAFERTVDGEVLDFGTSGMLFADNLVMYDRQSESLWPQLTGQASVGTMTGTQLVSIPMGTVAWSEFREAHPDSLVLTEDTGFERPYGSNPYVGYDDPNGGLLFGSPSDVDDRLAVKERVIGLGEKAEAVAVVRSSLAGTEPTELSVAGLDVVVWHRPGQVSALDSELVDRGQDVGTVGVFVPEADGKSLSFERAGDGFRDRETGSEWNVLGQAVAGPLEGEQLAAVEHLDTFWFAWVAFNPDSEVVRAG